MRPSFGWPLAFTLVACGGRLSSEPGGPPHGAYADAMASANSSTGPNSGDGDTTGSANATPSNAPIDASGLPTAFVLDCGNSAPPIAFKLPCFVTTGEDDTVCYALDDASPPPHLAFAFWEPLLYLAAHRNEPLNLDSTPVPPPPGFFGQLT